MRCVKLHDWHCRSQHCRGSRCSWPICPDFLLSNLSGGMLNAKQCLLTAAIVIGGTACAWAQGLNDPKAEYLSHCAGCHGDGAKGDGPLSTRLTIKPADLTVLSRKNKGVFPVSAVYAAVDGRNAIPSHGAHEMPIWGCRSSPSPVLPNKPTRPNVPDSYESHLDLACDSEDIIANRILSVIEHLRRVQEP
jgi:hypothetical protein